MWFSIPSPFASLYHTADIGISVEGSSREEVYARAALALAQLIAGQDYVSATEEKEISVAAKDRELLLREFLGELLSLYTMRGWLLSAVEIEQLSDTSIGARLRGGKFEPPEYPSGSDIKAVTYHNLKVEETEDGWTASVIFDV